MVVRWGDYSAPKSVKIGEIQVLYLKKTFLARKCFLDAHTNKPSPKQTSRPRLQLHTEDYRYFWVVLRDGCLVVGAGTVLENAVLAAQFWAIKKATQALTPGLEPGYWA